MRTTVRVLLTCAVFGSACFRATVPAATATASRSVFSDSAYHALMCESLRPNENWRTACQPKDQRAVFALPKEPPDSASTRPVGSAALTFRRAVGDGRRPPP